MGNLIRNRRDFLKTSLMGGIAITSTSPLKTLSPFGDAVNESTRVSLTTGDNRADMAFRALAPFGEEIARAIGDRQVVLKPNNVLIYVPLACTHVDTLEGILEFLKSINKLQNVIIAESSASAPTLSGFENYGYNKLLSRYPVRLVDLDSESFELMYVVKGVLEIDVNSRHYTINEGDAILIKKGEKHVSMSEEEVLVLIFESQDVEINFFE